MNDIPKKDFFYKTSYEVLLRNHLDALLTLNNLSQSDLALEVGVAPSYINHLVHSRLLPPDRIKKKIAKVLNCDTLDIWPSQFPSKFVSADEYTKEVKDESRRQRD